MLDLILYFPSFLLIFMRTTAFFVTMPFFSYRTIPGMHRIGLAFFFSLLIFSSLNLPILTTNGLYFMLIIKEALVGLTIGLIAMIIIYAIQVAGGFIDMKIGFMIANVIDPQSGAQSPLTGGYLYTFAILFILSLNAHHLILDGMFYSFQFVPLDQVTIPIGNEQVLTHVVRSFNLMFIIAFQMSMPIVGSLFLVDVALGMVSRSVPQVNVFVDGMPLKVAVGFVLMIVAMPTIFIVIRELIQHMTLTMRTLMQLYGGF